jgi:hypothetical protein
MELVLARSCDWVLILWDSRFSGRWIWCSAGVWRRVDSSIDASVSEKHTVFSFDRSHVLHCALILRRFLQQSRSVICSRLTLQGDKRSGLSALNTGVSTVGWACVSVGHRYISSLWWVSLSLKCQEIFASSPLPDRLWSPASIVSSGYRSLFPGGKAVGTWSWPVTSDSADVNAWSYTSTFPHVFMAWCFIKHQLYFVP